MLDTWIKFFKAHEKLVLLAVAGAALWFGVGKIDTLIAAHDNANLQQAKVIATAQQSKDAALATQAAQQAAQYQALAEKVQTQNTALAQANVALAVALTKQQKADAVMTPSELTDRWNVLVPNAGATPVATGVTIPDAGAHATVAQLEQVPVLTQELANTQTELNGEIELLTASSAQVTTLNSEVTGLGLQIVDNNRVCKDQIAVVKAAARKSKRRWFTAGIVVGWLSRQAVKTYLGY
jgi:hypothetical protein